MAKGKKTGGRRKGSKNKVPSSIMDDYLAVHAGLGGAEGMLTWARTNRSEFYRMLSKMLPRDLNVTANVKGVLEIVDIVRPDRHPPAEAGPETA